MTDFRLETVEEAPYLYVERECAMDPEAIAAAMGSAFQEVWAFMEKHGVAPSGGALSVYYQYSPDKMAFRAGFQVRPEDMAAASGEVKADVTPAGRVIYGVHHGPYGKIRESYGEMFGFLKEQGLEFAAPTWEVYLNSPEDVHEDQLLTALYQALS